MTMASPVDTSLLHLLHRTLQVGNERLMRELGDRDLTGRQLFVLKAIESNDGVSQTAIVNTTGVDRSTLADLMKRLMDRRLVSRKRSRADARAYTLSLTEEGRRTIVEADPILRKVEQEMLAVISAKHPPDLLGALKALAALG
jgi:MarR family transcriptional regulator, temperature-dependent positive regulator of motility